MMERWVNKVAVVTGASGGIGAAIVKKLVRVNLIVIGLARNSDRIEQLKNDIPDDLHKNLIAMKCDIKDENQVIEAFEIICKNFGGVDILVNNAGIFRYGDLATMDSASVKETIDTNIMGTVYTVKQYFKSMMERKVDGHIVIINSIAGHQVVVPIIDGPSTNIYPSTKFALTAIMQIYRKEFKKLDQKIKITDISPGMTRTAILPEEWAHLDTTYLQPDDIADSVLYAIGTPSHVEVNEIIIMPF